MRDRHCVVTQAEQDESQAAHIIPHGKGDNYLQLVLRLCSHCYDEITSVSRIDSVENGIFLSVGLHVRFGHGSVAFLKVPNFALNADDIPLLGENDPACIILHYLKYRPLARTVLATLAPGVVPYEQHTQAVFNGTGHPQPPSIILDFMWPCRLQTGLGSALVEQYKQRYLSNLRERHNPPQDDANVDGSPVEADDPGGGDYEPSDRSSSEQDSMIQAMDDMHYLSMYLSGVSPEEAAMRRINREREAERLAQEASRSKVTEWMKTGDVTN